MANFNSTSLLRCSLTPNSGYLPENKEIPVTSLWVANNTPPTSLIFYEHPATLSSSARKLEVVSGQRMSFVRIPHVDDNLFVTLHLLHGAVSRKSTYTTPTPSVPLRRTFQGRNRYSSGIFHRRHPWMLTPLHQNMNLRAAPSSRFPVPHTTIQIQPNLLFG